MKHHIQFYLDDLEDELTITALRMLVKDLLILFQAGNEGVINVLGEDQIVSFTLDYLVLNEVQSITLRCQNTMRKKP